MPDGRNLFEVVLDSWERNNRILVNFLRALPQDGLEARAMNGSPSIAEMYMHIHYVRLVFVIEDAPQFSAPLPENEWQAERNRARIAEMLNESAQVVRRAVQGKWESGEQTAIHYDSPILMLQHMIWHEGYHHGQMKLALKAAGTPIENQDIGPLTWRVWMDKSR